jgi:hypothetical protein
MPVWLFSVGPNRFHMGKRGGVIVSVAETADSAVKDPGWDDLVVGSQVGPLRYVVTPAMVEDFCAALPADPRPYGQGGIYADAVMPPTLLATDYIPLLRGHLDLGWGLMSRHSLKSLRPVRVNDTVTVTGRITDKFVKKGRHYWTLEYEVKNSAGEPCLLSTITCSVN